MEIYIIINKSNEKRYIGKTKHTALQRWKSHLQDMNHHKFQSRLYNAIRKYGVDNFECFPWETGIADNKVLNEREKYWIDVLEPEYNIASGGNGGLIGTGQLGKRWKIKDTSNMKKPKTITNKVIEGRKKISGANNYQCKVKIITPWGIFFTWREAVIAGRIEKQKGNLALSDAATLQKYCFDDFIIPKNSRRSYNEWKGKSTRQLGFSLESK